MSSGTLTIHSNDLASPKTLPAQSNPLPFLESVSARRITGTGTMFGITELSDVSDPPRKYKKLYASNIAIQRAQPSGVLPMHKYSGGTKTAYNTAGVQTSQIGIGSFTGDPGGDWQQTTPNSPTEVPADTPWALADAGYSGVGGFNVDSLEDAAPPAGWEDFWYVWTRMKKRKEVRAADIIRAAGEEAESPGLAWRSESIGSTTDGNARTNLNVIAFARNGLWRIAGFYSMTKPTGAGPSTVLRFKAEGGNHAIDDASDGALLLSFAATSDAEGSATTGWFGLDLPPNTSVRFHLDIVGHGSGHFPRSLDSEADEEETGLHPWIYLPADLGDDPVGPYFEALADEDTPEDALLRGGSSFEEIALADALAETAEFSGGITAESHDPISVEGTWLELDWSFINLRPNRVYRYIVRRESVPVGGGEATIDELEGQFASAAEVHLATQRFDAPIGYQSRPVRITLIDEGPVPSPEPGSEWQTETLAYYGAVITAGGVITDDQLDAVDDFIAAAKETTWWTKLRYLLPFVGENLEAALTPVVDNANGVGSFLGPKYGRPVNTNFVVGDLDTGLRGNGSNKFLLLPLRPGWLHSGFTNGGMLSWVEEWNGANAHLFGYQTVTGGDTRFVVALTAAAQAFGTWGLQANAALAAGQASDGCWHIRRSSATSRTLFKDGVSIDTDTTSDGATDAASKAVPLFCINDAAGTNVEFLDGRMLCFLAEDGSITNDEALSLFETLRDYLMAPLGRL